MKLNYINKIKANISIYSKIKSNNILEGNYKSIYKGKSLNFENLREYVINDNIKDIDWKSSARNGSLLVKQFVAEKKHNILLIMDSSYRMSADTDSHESKKEVALYSAGTIGYLAIKNNDYVGMLYYDSNKIHFHPFKYNLYNLDQYLCEYDKCNNTTDNNLNEIFKYVYKNISKKMIIFVFTDINGLNNLDENILKKISLNNDVLFININDNSIFGEDIYDLSSNKYITSYLSNNKKLKEVESNIKNELINKNTSKLKKNGINITSISSKSEINNKIINLLEEHRYGNK